MTGPNIPISSSVFFGQTFGSGVSLAIGKMNMIDFAATKPFMGGAGIDGFWNVTFAAPRAGSCRRTCSARS